MTSSDVTDITRIRNFAIIAHIDHGKSTLSDRMIQITGALSAREMQDQVLDSMDIERERGITIKAQTVRLFHTYATGEKYVLNLIDTPGHVDFGYEVSRSMMAVEGVLLLVDASQGVEAQTLANVYQALDAGHEIIVVLSKIDLPASDCVRVCSQIEDMIGLETEGAIQISGKTGEGVSALLDAIVERIPAPSGDKDTHLKALLVDSWYDPYLGVVVLIRVFEGIIRKGMRVKMFSTESVYPVERIGYFTPKMEDSDQLSAGEIGFFTGSIKRVADMRVGDTVTVDKKECLEPFPGFQPSCPVVFCGMFPIDAGDFDDLRVAISKLSLNDSSFSHEIETSAALGFGYRCGFLGLLHLEVIKERLEREYNLSLIVTAPSVVYRVLQTDETVIEMHNPADMPEVTKITHIEEPWITATIMMPNEYIGDVLKLCQERRGIQSNLSYSGNRAALVYKLPLNEVVFDFHDRLKSISQGYASFDYQIDKYELGDLVRLQILVNSEPVDALCMVVHRGVAEKRGRSVCEKLGSLIPQHMFQIPIQAAVGGRIVARETIKALRKDVTAKCYGGDVSRKKKLLEKQKAGKKRMRQFGKVEIPQEAFIKALKLDD
jgi:GTP-binding protein LepA